MSYSRTTWLEGETALSAANMNNIEDGIEECKDAIAALSAMLWPVGSIYMSVNNTNPGTIFGGTWVAWGTGRVPVGVDTSQTEFDTVEETGGAKSVTLNTNQMPSHTHGYAAVTGASAGSGNLVSSGGVKLVIQNPTASNATGGGQAHTNLQPYITCYMWKRTA